MSIFIFLAFNVDWGKGRVALPFCKGSWVDIGGTYIEKGVKKKAIDYHWTGDLNQDYNKCRKPAKPK